MTNVTGNGNFTSKLNQVLSASPVGIVEFFSALNIFLSITASLGNVLILIALHKVSSIYPPTKLFFRCLAVTDLCVGLIVQPLFATKLMAPFANMNMNALYYISKVNGASSTILCEVSLLTSAAISADRLLALLLGLRYRHVVTLRRVHVAIICVWLIAASGAGVWVWRRDIALLLASFLMTVSVVTSIFCYTRIHLRLRHHQVQLLSNVSHEQQNRGGIPLNIARYKKSVSTIFSVQLALIGCYVPWGIVVVLFVNGIKSNLLMIAVQTSVLLNSSLNPILYCWKIKEVKQAVKDTIRQIYCF